MGSFISVHVCVCDCVTKVELTHLMGVVIVSLKATFGLPVITGQLYSDRRR